MFFEQTYRSTNLLKSSLSRRDTGRPGALDRPKIAALIIIIIIIDHDRPAYVNFAFAHRMMYVVVTREKSKIQ